MGTFGKSFHIWVQNSETTFISPTSPKKHGIAFGFQRSPLLDCFFSQFWNLVLFRPFLSRTMSPIKKSIRDILQNKGHPTAPSYRLDAMAGFRIQIIVLFCVKTDKNWWLTKISELLNLSPEAVYLLYILCNIYIDRYSFSIYLALIWAVWIK